MKKITSAEPESKSEDVAEANVEALHALFPSAFTEGKVDFDVLRQLLGDAVDGKDEKYGLTWHGKRPARQLALTPSRATLRPCQDDSVDWEVTQNLVLEGDNLEVLKLLQKSYHGSVKLIFIDPPYNTGGDFVYPDQFKDSIGNYLRMTGQDDGESPIPTNSESSGRFHTRWLNMMYPRLRLARSLLAEDGVLFATIDDTEVAHLRLLLDDVFGEENFVSSIAWKKRSSPDARSTIGSVHDWILCYVKNEDRVKDAVGKMPLSASRREAYKNPDNDPRGPWASVDMTGMTGRATADQYFEVTLPSGRVIGPPPGRSWGLAKKTFLEMRDDGRIWFGSDGDNVPRMKRFLSESDGQVVPSLWDMSEVGSNDEAKKEANGLMGVPNVFDTPKPVRLLERMVEIATREDSIVLDFFAGSGTTGHAVMKRNAADGGNRRFILVQLPEVLDAANRHQAAAAKFCEDLGKPLTIAELTKERLRRAAADLEAPTAMNGELGFRVFKLDSSNLAEWDPDRDDLDRSLLDALEHIKDGRSEADILFELVLKLGLELTVTIETRELGGISVHSVGAGTLMACLAATVSDDDVETVALGIADWHRELDPVGETTVVFRDDAFGSDVAKANMTAILEQRGLATVRSL